MQRDRTNALRFPSLVLPFAVLGGAVGWAATNLLENPLVSIAMYASPHLAAFIGASAAGLVGVAVTSWARRQPGRDDAWIRPVRLRVRMALGVVLSGVTAGAFVGGITRLHGGLWSGAICGGFTARLCAAARHAAVFAAGVRAQRARLGSIVAAADRRAIWVMCSGALVVPALATALDWPMWAAGRGDAPWPGLWMTGIAAIGLLLAIVVRDRAALTSLDLVAKNVREATRDPSIDAPRVDLGLGEGLAARYAATASAYRGGEREEMVLVGSVGEAAAALRRARVRSTSALVAALACGLVHVAAGSRLLERPVLVAVFDHDASWCHLAGIALDAARRRPGGEPRPARQGLPRLRRRGVQRARPDHRQPRRHFAQRALLRLGPRRDLRRRRRDELPLAERVRREAQQPIPTPGSDLACRGGEPRAAGPRPASVDPSGITSLRRRGGRRGDRRASR